MSILMLTVDKSFLSILSMLWAASNLLFCLFQALVESDFCGNAIFQSHKMAQPIKSSPYDCWNPWL